MHHWTFDMDSATTRIPIDDAVALAAAHDGVYPTHPHSRVMRWRLDERGPLRDERDVRGWYDEHPHDGGYIRDECLVVLDVEHPSKGGPDGFATLRELEDVIGELPVTRIITTKHGGRHLHFTRPAGFTIKGSASPRGGEIRALRIALPGIDVKAGAQMITVPPTAGYALALDEPAVALPERWARVLAEPETQRLAVLPSMRSVDRQRRIAVAALRDEAAELAALGAGRGAALNRAAFNLGQLADALDFSEIEAALYDAAVRNGKVQKSGKRAVLATILRGYRAGVKHPRRAA